MANNHISLHIQPLLVAYSTTRIPMSSLGEIPIFHPDAIHIILHEARLTTRWSCLGANITTMALQTNIDTTSYIRIIKNRMTFSAPSLLLSHLSVKTHQIRTQHKDPTNSAFLPKQPLPPSTAQCLVAPIALQKSSRIHSSEDEANVANKSVWLF